MNEDENLTLVWVTEPPIVKIEGEDIAFHANSLKDRCVDWKSTTQERELACSAEETTEGVDPNDEVEVLKKWLVRKELWRSWNALIRDTRFVANMFSWSTGSECYAYLLGGHAIGLISLRTEVDHICVDQFVTHPGSANCGGILAEYAVKLAQKRNLGGILRLLSLTGSSTEKYKGLGFEKLDDNYTTGGDMVLDPSACEMWNFVNGRYCLARYSGSSFASALP